MVEQDAAVLQRLSAPSVRRNQPLERKHGTLFHYFTSAGATE
jgi:hypothetical protein